MNLLRLLAFQTESEVSLSVPGQLGVDKNTVERYMNQLAEPNQPPQAICG